MPLLNYTTKVDVYTTIGAIQGQLVKHGAKKIMQEYDDAGRITALSFQIDTPNGMRGIVASAFLPRGENETQVNHKNGVHEDNRAENLEWCTARENIRHKYDVLKYRWENHIRRMTEVNSHPVVCCETGTVYQSMAQAARSVGTNSGHICECIKGRRKTAAGYHWRADEEAEKALQEMEDKNDG